MAALLNIDISRFRLHWKTWSENEHRLILHLEIWGKSHLFNSIFEMNVFIIFGYTPFSEMVRGVQFLIGENTFLSTVYFFVFYFLRLLQNIFSIGVRLLYSVMLVSAVQKHKSAIVYIYPSPLHRHRAPSWAPWDIQWLPTNYFTYGSIYISVLISQFTLPSLHAHMSIFLRLCLYSSPADRFLCTTFLVSTYTLIYDIYFSLSDSLHSVRQTLIPWFTAIMTWNCV